MVILTVMSAQCQSPPENKIAHQIMHEDVTFISSKIFSSSKIWTLTQLKQLKTKFE